MNRPRSAATAEPLSKSSTYALPAEQGRHGQSEPEGVAVLEAAPGSSASRLAERHADRSPVLVFCLTLLAGWLLVAGATIGLGFLLVDVILPHGIGHSDEAVNEWLASHRTSFLNDASYVGSMIGDVPFIPALVIVVILGAAALRRWRIAAFVAGAILVEVATYRLTSLIVHRQRPAVPRLDPDHLPVNQSYPSGHVAASVVVYVGLALLIISALRGRSYAALVWVAAVALPLIVAFSRMYRGMHHPVDATVGVLMGLASLAVALFATRAAVEIARRRAPANRQEARA